MRALLAVCLLLVGLSLAHAAPVPGAIYDTQADTLYNKTRLVSGVAFFDSVIVDTSAVGMGDSSRVIDGNGYDFIEAEVFVISVTDTCVNPWTKIALRVENQLVGGLLVNRVHDSLATSINIDEPKYDLSGRGSLNGDSLTYTNVPVGVSPGNLAQARPRPGETQLIIGMPRLWHNANFAQKSNGVSVMLNREANKPLRFFRLHSRVLAQSCYFGTVKPRLFVRLYLYKRADRKPW